MSRTEKHNELARLQSPTFTVIIPIFKNAEFIDQLFASLESSLANLAGPAEIIFVNDASPDESNDMILRCARVSPLKIRIIQHSRNFGSFAAIRTGMEYAKGDFVGVISADLQEPASLLADFFTELAH